MNDELIADYALTVGSLFSGIGGIDLGLERAGFRVIWQAETDPYASWVLAKHWPDVPNLGDVTQIDWSTVERPDLLCGGFPCQPVSVAGRRRGQNDERWLWPEYARAICGLRPAHVLVENVPGLLVRGMGDVLGDLASLGYDTEWESIPAAAVGAPHLRYRVLIAAHAVSDKLWQQPISEPRSGSATVAGDDGQNGAVAHTDGQRLEERWLPAEGREDLPHAARSGRSGQGARALAYTNSPGREGPGVRRPAPERRADVAHPEGVTIRAGLCEGDPSGVWERRSGDLRSPGSGWWAVEPDLGRVADGVPARVDRLRCLGNAVVPQVAELVGRRLIAHIDGRVSDG